MLFSLACGGGGGGETSTNFSPISTPQLLKNLQNGDSVNIKANGKEWLISSGNQHFLTSIEDITELTFYRYDLPSYQVNLQTNAKIWLETIEKPSDIEILTSFVQSRNSNNFFKPETNAPLDFSAFTYQNIDTTLDFQNWIKSPRELRTDASPILMRANLYGVYLQFIADLSSAPLESEKSALLALHKVLVGRSSAEEIFNQWTSSLLPIDFKIQFENGSSTRNIQNNFLTTGDGPDLETFLTFIRQPQLYSKEFIYAFRWVDDIKGNILGATSVDIPLYLAGPDARQLKTNIDGSFHFRNLKAGVYQLKPQQANLIFDPALESRELNSQRSAPTASFTSYVLGSQNVPSPDQVMMGISYTSSDGKTIVQGTFKPISSSMVEYYVRNSANQVEFILIDGSTASGSFEVPNPTEVKSGILYGPTGAELTGTYTGTTQGSDRVPADREVLWGIVYTSNDGTSTLIGAYQTAQPPPPEHVLNGITYTTADGLGTTLTGTLNMPPEHLVLNSINYTSNNGQTVSGNAKAPFNSQVLAGISFSDNLGNTTMGNLVIPTAGQVLEGVTFGAGGSQTGAIYRKILTDTSDSLTLGFYESTLLSTIDSDLASLNIKSGTNIFGFVGNSNIQNTTSGNLISAVVLNGYTGYSQGQSVTGNIPTRSLSSESNIMLAGYYSDALLSNIDGDLSAANILSGTNIFGIIGTASPALLGGNANASHILSGYTALSDGNLITGTIPNTSISNLTSTFSTGYILANDLSTLDSDLVSNNIKSGTNIFGIIGNSNIVDSSSGNAVSANILNGVIAWAQGTSVTGSMPTVSLSATSPLFNTGYITSGNLVSIDSDLMSSNIKASANIFGIVGNSNIVDTSSGNAISANILSGVSAWTQGAIVTGSMPTVSLSATSPLFNTGYITSGNLVSIDSDLMSTNIKASTNIFGIVGNSNIVDTSAGNAVSANILNGVSAWTQGALVTGSMPTVSLGNTSPIFNAGYIASGNLVSIDSDLISTNIKASANIFGIIGNSNIVDTSSGNAISANILNGVSAWTQGALVTGSMPTVSLSTTSPLFNTGYITSGNLTNIDSDFISTNFAPGANIFGIVGDMDLSIIKGSNGISFDSDNDAGVEMQIYGTGNLHFWEVNAVIEIPGAVNITQNLSVSGNIVSSGNLNIGNGAFYVDATNSKIGIGTTSPKSQLDIQGSFSFSTEIVTSSTTLSGNQQIFADSSSGNITLTLPSALTTKGRVYLIKKTSDLNSVTIQGTQNIDSAPTVEMLPTGTSMYSSLGLVSSGVQWYITQSSGNFQ
jgi:hypothetical protein